MRSRWRPMWALGLLAGLVAGANCPAWAGTSYVDLKWSHPDPANLRGFALLLASEEGDVEGAEVVDVGLPLRDGVYRWSVPIGEDETVWVAVVAVDRGGGRSQPSGWRRFEWDPSQTQLGTPGRPFLVEQSPPSGTPGSR